MENFPPLLDNIVAALVTRLRSPTKRRKMTTCWLQSRKCNYAVSASMSMSMSYFNTRTQKFSFKSHVSRLENDFPELFFLKTKISPKSDILIVTISKKLTRNDVAITLLFWRGIVVIICKVDIDAVPPAPMNM